IHWVLRGQRLRQVTDVLPHPALLDRIVRPHEFERFTVEYKLLLQLPDSWKRRSALGVMEVARTGSGGGIAHVLVKIGDRAIEHQAEIPKTACADPIGAALVFLHLLEGQP